MSSSRRHGLPSVCLPEPIVVSQVEKGKVRLEAKLDSFQAVRGLVCRHGTLADGGESDVVAERRSRGQWQQG